MVNTYEELLEQIKTKDHVIINNPDYETAIYYPKDNELWFEDNLYFVIFEPDELTLHDQFFNIFINFFKKLSGFNKHIQHSRCRSMQIVKLSKSDDKSLIEYLGNRYLHDGYRISTYNNNDTIVCIYVNKPIRD